MFKYPSFKSQLFILFFCFLSVQLFAQETDWLEYEMDSIVVEFPSEDVRLLDTITGGIKLKQLFTTVGTSTFILQKLPLKTNRGNSIVGKLPHDKESLLNYYEGVSKGTIKGIGAESVKSEEIKLGQLIGYKSIFSDSNGKPFYEMRTFLVNNNIVNICYYEKSKMNSSLKNKFFDTLDLSLIEPINQFAEEDIAYETGYKVGYFIAQSFIYIMMALATIGLIWLIVRKKKKKPLQ